MDSLNQRATRRANTKLVRIAIPLLLVAGLIAASIVTVAYFRALDAAIPIPNYQSEAMQWKAAVEKWRPIGILAIALLTAGATMFVRTIPNRRAARSSKKPAAAGRPSEPLVSHAGADLPSYLAPFQPFLLRESLGKDRWRLCFGLLARAAAIACFLVAINGRAIENVVPSAGLIALPCLILCSVLLNLAHGLFSRRAPELLTLRSNRPILYLRSFTADSRWFESWSDLVRIIGGVPPETAECALAKAARGVGPVVAIGCPGERVPPVGAARLYVAHDQWQTVVQQLIAQSQLVVLRFGATEGFWWELQHVVKNCDPRRVLIYLPRRDRKRRYELLRQRAAEILPQSLPTFFLHGYFLGFDADWTPYRCPIYGPRRVSKFRRFLLRSPAPCIRDGLNDALAAVGLPRCGMPFQLREWILILVAATMAVSIGLMALFIETCVLLFVGAPI